MSFMHLGPCSPSACITQPYQHRQVMFNLAVTLGELMGGTEELAKAGN